MSKELAELANDPVPLLSYQRNGWRVTEEGFRQIGVEPVAARFPFRPRDLPARSKRRRNAIIRKDTLGVLSDGNTPVVE